MTYAQAVEHLHKLTPELAAPSRDLPGQPPRANKFDLAHMRTLCAALGDPQDQVSSVLIAGTNGKGSTAATLASILSAAGYRTGLYTSPHLSRVNERIQLARPTDPPEYGSASVHNADGPLRLEPIADLDFARFYTQVDDAAELLVRQERLPHLPSFFERLTTVAFLYFATRQAEIMVLEVGLGGRLDATNIVEPLVSVITDIALDHQAYLGDTIAQIAREKAGILRRAGTLITLAQHADANQAIGEVATALAVTGINAAEYLPEATRNNAPEAESDASAPSLGRNCYVVAVRDNVQPGELNVDSPLSGEHQRRNLALAIAAAVRLRNKRGYDSDRSCNTLCYTIPNTAIEQGISTTRWPGRLEFLTPGLLLDVAHNPAGAWSLRAALGRLPQSRPRTLLFSCLGDKKVAEMASILFPLFDNQSGEPLRASDHIVLAPIANSRATSLDDLLAVARALDVPVHAAPHIPGALAQALDLTPAEGLVVVTGSIYLVGEVRDLILAEHGSAAVSHAG